MEDIQKPQVVEDNNQSMGGVDKSKYHVPYTKSVIESPFISDVINIIFLQAISWSSTMGSLTALSSGGKEPSSTS